MDKDYLLDLMVNVREKMISVDEAVETICTIAEPRSGNIGLNTPVIMPCFCLKCGSHTNTLSEGGFYECSNEDCKQLYTVMMSDDGQTCLLLSNNA